MLDKLNPLKKLASRAGTVDEEKATFWTTPWAWRDNEGCYRGHNKEVWLYRQMSVHPLRWEDPTTRLSLGSPLATLLYELGETSKDMGVGIRALARSREIHILSVTWEEEARPPEGTPAALSEYLDATLQFVVPVKALVVGVKLWPSMASTGQGILDQIRNQATAALDEEGPGMDGFDADRRLITEILSRNGAHIVPNRTVRDQIESWYNLGRGPDVSVMETKDLLFVDDFDRIEMAAVMGFDNPIMYAPDSMWALDAGTHPAGASVISVRGVIEPSSVSRNRVRRSQRKVIAQIEEEAATGDLDRPEQSQTLNLAQEVERFILNGREPLISECSILMARRVGPDAAETYIDELRGSYGIEMKPLEHRQMAALDETLPTSSKRVNPFLQDVSVAMLAHCGLQGHSNLGDPTGVYVGLVDPDYTPCYLNPLGAPAADRPPAMLVAGDPGSGKTFACQNMALQAALGGLNVIFINPKGMSTLAGLTTIAPNGKVVNLSEIEKEGGYFDPFRFTEQTPAGRQIAADIAGQHILGVLGTRGVAGMGLTQEQEISLLSGLRQGAERGARCVAEALQAVEDPHVSQLVMQQASDPLFRLGIGMHAMPPYNSDRGLLLIEFDRPLDIPEKGIAPSDYTRTQRLALAAVRLVTRASLEILGGGGGGMLVVDEAWMFLQSSEGLAALQSMGRLGRSQNILPVFATQRVDDLIKEGVDMESYLSRVFVMQLNDEREARAALRLCGLEATAERIAWLRQAGPRRGDNGQPSRGAMALHRDLNNRHSAVLIGPVPQAAREAFTTNPEDLRRRQVEVAARAAETDQQR